LFVPFNVLPVLEFIKQASESNHSAAIEPAWPIFHNDADLWVGQSHKPQRWGDIFGAYPFGNTSQQRLLYLVWLRYTGIVFLVSTVHEKRLVAQLPCTARESLHGY